jgi:DNA gyrase/topoisomerase IV subunit A
MGPDTATAGRGTLSDMTNRDPDFGSEEDLQDALRQVHIYEAIAIAASDAHSVLDVMLTAADPGAASRALMDRYAFTEVQAWAVTELQFRRMTATDRKKIEQRRHELGERVKDLEQQLGRA